MLKKEHKWEWSRACEVEFIKLKEAISSTLVLKSMDFDFPFEVHTDASYRAIGGVIALEGEHVLFERRKLKEAEQRYSVHEKEIKIVVHYLVIWRHYFLGNEFMVVMDNVANT